MTIYDSKDIKTLTDIESVQINPDQYIGSTENPTHLIEEAFDNALDEAQSGNVSVIAVNIDTVNNIYSVIDNGRGIPIKDNVPELISTKLHSGAKFRGAKTAYEICAGLHGIGLVTLTALSDTYTIEVYRDDSYGRWNFVDSKLKKKEIKPFTDKKPFSTKIQFKPSSKYFASLIPDIDRVRRRITIASAEMSTSISFILSIDGKQEIVKLNLMEHFKKLCCNGDDLFKNVIYFKSLKSPEEFNVIFSYSKNGTSLAPRALSSINLLPVDDGGTHINIFFEILRNFLVEKGKKLDYSFQPNDTLIGLRAYLMLRLKEPRFGGQTKGKLTNRKDYFEVFEDNLKKQIEAYFNKNNLFLEELLKQFQEYRRKLDSKKIKSKASSKSTEFTKLRDCINLGGELFISEGESASGGLVSCRNPRIHAILPLKGKIPNTATKKEILKNKEVFGLINSLGTGYGNNFEITNLKYSKIICATDADEDGLHIFCLVTLALALLVPEIIKQGFYYYAQTPLYAINEKNNFVPLWTNDEVSDAKNSGRKLIRAKGLGELNPDQLKKVLIDDTRRLIPISFTSNIEKITELFIDANEKRKLLIGEWKL